jgi:alpha-tubulin suppressor-like RCC1 family protein
MVLDDQGNVYAWGASYSGDTNTSALSLPVKISGGVVPGSALDSSVKIESIAMGGGAGRFAIDNTGQVYTWGYGYYNLGLGGNNSYYLPTQLNSGAFSTAPRIVDISTSGNHTIAVDDQGSVYSWGSNYYGQLGNNKATDAVGGGSCNPPSLPGSPYANACSTPVDISSLPGSPLNGVKVTRVVADGNYSIAIDENGDVWAWGSYYDEQNKLTLLSNVPVKISGEGGLGDLQSAITTVTLDANGTPVDCTDVKVISQTEIRCTTSTHLAGTVDVMVQTGSYRQATLSAGYRYGDRSNNSGSGNNSGGSTGPIVPGAPSTGKHI